VAAWQQLEHVGGRKHSAKLETTLKVTPSSKRSERSERSAQQGPKRAYDGQSGRFRSVRESLSRYIIIMDGKTPTRTADSASAPQGPPNTEARARARASPSGMAMIRLLTVFGTTMPIPGANFDDIVARIDEYSLLIFFDFNVAAAVCAATLLGAAAPSTLKVAFAAYVEAHRAAAAAVHGGDIAGLKKALMSGPESFVDEVMDFASGTSQTQAE